MHNTSMSIEWPAMIKYLGLDELDYIASMDAWMQHQSVTAPMHHPEDKLIDSSGAVYNVQALSALTTSRTNGPDDDPVPAPCVGKTTLEDIIDLIRAHASQQGTCCIAKLYATSIAEAIVLIKPYH